MDEQTNISEPGSKPPLQVTVLPLELGGDQVTFSWTQSEPNQFQIQNSFFFRYEHLDVSSFSVELFYEIFLALQIRVYAGYVQRVELVFPSPVPKYSAEYWLAFNQATSVTVSPLSAEGGYNPWTGAPVLFEQPRKAAVFFGGGKDSVLATCLLSEMYGPDEVVAVQFVAALRSDPKLIGYLETRQEQLMLKPAREVLGVATQRVWTNYQSIFRKEGYSLRPNLELFTVGSMPALLAWGVQVSTISFSWTTYSLLRYADGLPVYRYARSRHEALELQGRHFNAVLGVPLTFTNVTFPFNALLVYWLIAERYPKALPHVVMCTVAGVDRRWCYQCKKCWLYGFLGLATGIIDSRFDYNQLLSESRFMKTLIDYSATGVEPTELGNVRWVIDFSNKRSFIMCCHMIARIDLDDLSVKLGDVALANLALLKALYGNRLFPDFEAVPRVTLDVLGTEIGPKLARIAAEHFEIIDHVPGPWFAGNMPISYPFHERMPLPVDTLEHLAR